MPLSRRALLTRLGAAGVVAAAPRSVLSAGAPPSVDRSGHEAPPGRIRLDRNENAYGPSPHALAALQQVAAEGLHRYPDTCADTLRSRVARVHNVRPDQVVLGCGSTEILRMAVDACVGPSRHLVTARPTFAWMAVCARRSGAVVAAVPLTANHSHDLDRMRARIDSAAGLVYICNPNNPTGTLTRRRDIEAFIRSLPPSTYVLVDEAYHHYAGESSDYASFIDRPVDDPRVIVSRSFSKIYGLAALRVGYAICATETARLLESQELPAGINLGAALAAVAALDDADHVRACMERNVDDRQEFLNQANARMLRVIDSQTNFLMVNTGVPAGQIVEHFARHDVLVTGPVDGFETHIRVSLGTASDMRQFWSVWDRLPAHHMM